MSERAARSVVRIAGGATRSALATRFKRRHFTAPPAPYKSRSNPGGDLGDNPGVIRGVIRGERRREFSVGSRGRRCGHGSVDEKPCSSYLSVGQATLTAADSIRPLGSRLNRTRSTTVSRSFAPIQERTRQQSFPFSRPCSHFSNITCLDCWFGADHMTYSMCNGYPSASSKGGPQPSR